MLQCFPTKSGAHQVGQVGSCFPSTGEQLHHVSQNSEGGQSVLECVIIEPQCFQERKPRVDKKLWRRGPWL